MKKWTGYGDEKLYKKAMRPITIKSRQMGMTNMMRLATEAMSNAYTLPSSLMGTGKPMTAASVRQSMHAYYRSDNFKELTKVLDDLQRDMFKDYKYSINSIVHKYNMQRKYGHRRNNYYFKTDFKALNKLTGGYNYDSKIHTKRV